MAAPRFLWPLLIGLNLLLHLPFFTQPPTSIHVWRQSNTMAVARNFYEEDMNILRPRVDNRKSTNGVTGMQFPSYEWVVALTYKVLGFQEAIPRVINWLIFLAGVVAFHRLVLLLTGSAWLAAAGAWMLSWSPELFYHSINALPDVLALSASLWGLYFFLRWYQHPSFSYFILSLLATTLGGLTKLQYLVVGVPIGALILRDWVQGRFDWRSRLGPIALFAGVSVGLTLAWYAYALRLIELSGLTDFGLEVRSASSWAAAVAILKDNVVSDVPELLLNFATFGLLLLGLFAIWRKRYWQQSMFFPLFAWSLVLGVYHLLELKQMADHQYYMLPHLPVLLLVAVVGAKWLREQSGRGAHLALWVLLLAQPALAFVRVVPPRWLRGPNGLPPELYYNDSRARLRAAAPDSALCVVGPDDSGCIDFYFLHKKGFGFAAKDQLFAADSTGRPYLSRCIQAGARYLYTNDSTLIADPRLKPYVRQPVVRVGDFRVVALQVDSLGRQ
jgi:hypothetical protein